MSSPELPGPALEALLVSYRSAVALLQYEATLVWQKVSAMLLTESILVVVVMNQSTQKFLGPIATAIGLVVAILWIALVRRGVRTFDYWLAIARQDEQIISAIIGDKWNPHNLSLGDRIAPLSILSLGRQLSKNNEVVLKFPFDNEFNTLRFRGFEKWFKGRLIEAWILPSLFIAFFVAAFGTWLAGMWQAHP